MKKSLPFFLLLILVTFPLFSQTPQTTIIRGGEVYDGSLQKPVRTDVMIEGDRIVFVGDCSDKKADRIIDATGYIVAPGFIDPHSHSNVRLAKKGSNSNENMLQMGVTTVLCGVCGGSPYPIGKTFAKMLQQGIGTNCGFFLGHSTLRRNVMNGEQRAATKEEIAKMKAIISSEMDQGAFGLSSGLYYNPGCYATTEEMIELAKAMADKEGIYSTHIRSEGEGLYTSIEEAIRIAREANVQLNISHIKTTLSYKGKTQDIVDLIENAQKEGMIVTADQYPYLASGTTLRATVLPRWAEAGGRKAVVRRLKNKDTLERILPYIEKNIAASGGPSGIIATRNCDSIYSGKTLKEIAKMLHTTPARAAADLLIKSNLSIVKFIVLEKGLKEYMKKPWVMTCTDGTLGSHPRATGSYPLKMQEFVLRKKILSMTEMIYRSSGMVAKTYGIEKRGFIKEGNFADLIVFNPKEFLAHSTYANTLALATGMKFVFVNGTLAVEDSHYTGALAGRPVKKHNASKDPAIFEAKMNRFLKENGVIGMVASVVKDNKIIYTGSFGRRDTNNLTAFREDHRDLVRIASISKSFCATALMQLVEAGKLSLEEEVGDIMGFEIRNPLFPETPITVAMLLSHTSSLNDSQGYGTLDKINPSKNKNFKKCYSAYAPGSGYKYCNLNFNLLGAVVERKSGMRYDKYIKSHILDPLDMHASLNIKDLDTTLCVPLYSYSQKTKSFLHNPQAYYPLSKSDSDYIQGYDAALFSTTGGMKCDAPSLARYMIMHMNYGIVDGTRIMLETSARLMQSRLTATDAKDIWYGFAMRSMDKSWIPGLMLKGHTGSAYGMSSTMTFCPEEKFGFVTLCNGSSGKRPGMYFDRMLYYHFIY